MPCSDEGPACVCGCAPRWWNVYIHIGLERGLRRSKWAEGCDSKSIPIASFFIFKPTEMVLETPRLSVPNPYHNHIPTTRRHNIAKANWFFGLILDWLAWQKGCSHQTILTVRRGEVFKPSESLTSNLWANPLSMNLPGSQWTLLGYNT